MKTIDLTYPMHGEMPVFPGTESPLFQKVFDAEADGFNETRLSFYSHTGTHIDAPYHMLAKGKTLDQFPIEKYYGKGAVIKHPQESPQINLDDLLPHEKLCREIDFLLFDTGWGNYWGTPKYFEGFPVLSEEAAKWLAAFSFKGIGFDTISFDAMDSLDFQVHHILLSKDIILIENLANLEELPGKIFDFQCFPLNYLHADGSPVRAVAFV